jgi:hypothetical protein
VRRTRVTWRHVLIWIVGWGSSFPNRQPQRARIALDHAAKSRHPIPHTLLLPTPTVCAISRTVSPDARSSITQAAPSPQTVR